MEREWERAGLCHPSLYNGALQPTGEHRPGMSRSVTFGRRARTRYFISTGLVAARSRWIAGSFFAERIRSAGTGEHKSSPSLGRDLRTGGTRDTDLHGRTSRDSRRGTVIALYCRYSDASVIACHRRDGSDEYAEFDFSRRQTEQCRRWSRLRPEAKGRKRPEPSPRPALPVLRGSIPPSLRQPGMLL